MPGGRVLTLAELLDLCESPDVMLLCQRLDDVAATSGVTDRAAAAAMLQAAAAMSGLLSMPAFVDMAMTAALHALPETRTRACDASVMPGGCSAADDEETAAEVIYEAAIRALAAGHPSHDVLAALLATAAALATESDDWVPTLQAEAARAMAMSRGHRPGGTVAG